MIAVATHDHIRRCMPVVFGPCPHWAISQYRAYVRAAEADRERYRRAALKRIRRAGCRRMTS